MYQLFLDILLLQRGKKEVPKTLFLTSVFYSTTFENNSCPSNMTSFTRLHHQIELIKIDFVKIFCRKENFRKIVTIFLRFIYMRLSFS